MQNKFDNVVLTIEEPKAIVLFNRPEKKNAMSPALHQDMNDVITEIERSGGVKIVVLTGSGPSFCGGMDLEKCFLEPFPDPDEFARVNGTALAWMQRWKKLRAITLASINGWCFGGGMAVVGICDMAIAAEEAVFGLSEINFGIFPGGGTTWATVHNFASHKQGFYCSVTGETFTGLQAAEMGFINKTVPLKKLGEETDRIVSMIIGKNIHTLRAAKEVYNRSMFMDYPESVEWEMAKLMEMSYLSKNAWIEQALTQFKARKFRPGLETYTLEEGQ